MVLEYIMGKKCPWSNERLCNKQLLNNKLYCRKQDKILTFANSHILTPLIYRHRHTPSRGIKDLDTKSKVLEENKGEHFLILG